MKSVILIPAYNPEDTLINLIDDLTMLKIPIVVVNDGSEKQYDYIFQCIDNREQVKVINHECNKGKGRALKSGIKYIVDNYKECIGIITADADGQHLPQDIIKIGKRLIENPDSLILGVRDFNKLNIPWKSRMGNKITSLIFYLLTRRECEDTQTGLRGISKSLFHKCLDISGERYEYEMNVLMELTRDNINYVYEPINTVYINKNIASHFSPVRDSLKIYFQIFKFSFVSLMSSLLDIGMFTLLMYFLNINLAYKILVATILARIISGTFNFTINKLWVFSSKDKSVREIIKYGGLFLIIMMCSYLGVSMLSFLAIPIILIKIIVDGTLFVLNYKIQDKLIFVQGRN